MAAQNYRKSLDENRIHAIQEIVVAATTTTTINQQQQHQRENRPPSVSSLTMYRTRQ